MLRVVLDTNVLVSAIISDGKPRELLKKGISKKQFFQKYKTLLAFISSSDL
jgi:predicted nucleic acid-binding protein